MMILLDLHLQNFKRYKEFTIKFDQGLVGIIGKNGSGKSTIFESILFALYGELKTKGYKETIRNSSATTKEPVVVELLFEFENLQYKIIREFRGKTLSASAKLFKNGELIVSGAKEVTQNIIKLTKMSKDAFIHTLFASQKELTSLSSLKNEDRKKMIRKLLGLEKIDFIEKELIEKSRQIKRDLEAFKEVLLSNEELTLKQKQIDQFTNEKSSLEKELQLQSTELNKQKLKETHIKKELDNFVQAKEKKQNLFSSLELIKNNISSKQTNNKKLLEELNQLKLKQKEHEKQKGVKEEFEKIENDLKEHEVLKEKALKKDGLLKEQEQLRIQYTKAKDDIKLLEKESLMYDKHIFDAKNINENIAHIQDNIIEKQTIEKELLAQIAGEEKIIDETNSKIDNLKRIGKESNCPICTRPLIEEYDNVISSLNQIVEGTHKQKIKEHKIQLEHVLEQKNKYEIQLKQKQTLHQELTKNISIIQSKQKDLKKVEEYFKQIEIKGLQNKTELQLLEQYNYDEKSHKTVQNKYTAVKVQYEDLLKLQTQLQRLPLIQKDIDTLLKEIKELEKNHEDKQTLYNEVIYDNKKHLAKTKEFEELQKQKDKRAQQLNEIKVSIAKIEGQIKTIKTTLLNNQKHLDKLQTKKDDLKDYEKIKSSLISFKTKLNGKIAPRISDIASNLYTTITKGKYQHIEVNNDFDFYIYDEGVKYPIDRFSGGEIDLANLVLRIAISKTLAELNGSSSVGFLAFDEVFGSQDEARRLQILEAFHTIKEQYRQIFLISHEIEIKEMFERVIEL
ncbi:MAG: SMC family ATPase [Campylobacterota bacterium]|nr:SMC family ATPase [Campylobacterota bacterium]